MRTEHDKLWWVATDSPILAENNDTMLCTPSVWCGINHWITLVRSPGKARALDVLEAFSYEHAFSIQLVTICADVLDWRAKAKYGLAYDQGEPHHG